MSPRTRSAPGADQSIDYVLRTTEERGIRFVQLWFTDILGIPKGFTITSAELENALREGMTFDGSSVEGFSRVQEADMMLMPDCATFQILPFEVEGQPVARVICDIHTLEGMPFEGCPRRILKRALASAHSKGLTFYAASELEYFYFASPDLPPAPLDSSSYFDLSVTDAGTELRKKAVLALEEMGIPVEHSQHEDAPSQHEIDLRHTDALSMADTVMTARLVVKGLASSQGAYASFMPKPLMGTQGSGLHTHFSLFSGEKNVFFDATVPDKLSKKARQFIAGVLHHARAITAVANQWVNSYKRLVPGFEAPVHIAWARNNRSALVRVPLPKGGREEAVRIEYRGADAACNPYLTFALVLAAGLDGIENGYELPPEATDNLFDLTDDELAKRGIERLPRDLEEALEAMENSELVQRTLGVHAFEWFIKNKKSECQRYCEQITPFELNSYFRLL